MKEVIDLVGKLANTVEALQTALLKQLATQPEGYSTKKLQELLNAKGYECGTSGEWDAGTNRAMLAFQAAEGLDSLGFCDQATWDKLTV